MFYSSTCLQLSFGRSVECFDWVGLGSKPSVGRSVIRSLPCHPSPVKLPGDLESSSTAVNRRLGSPKLQHNNNSTYQSPFDHSVGLGWVGLFALGSTPLVNPSCNSIVARPLGQVRLRWVGFAAVVGQWVVCRRRCSPFQGPHRRPLSIGASPFVNIYKHIWYTQ